MACNRNVTVVIGAQWGDEGKGKIVDYLCPKFDYVCRCQGGCNAGHTVKTGGQTFKFHLLPCGVAHENAISIIGNGCVITLPQLFKEICDCNDNGIKDVEKRLLISDRAHVVTSLHRIVDCDIEDSLSRIGTTRNGIGPCYASKVARFGIRLCDIISDTRKDLEDRYKAIGKFFKICLSDEDVKNEIDVLESFKDKLTSLVSDSILTLMGEANRNNENVLVEGANGVMLDIDFGTYPYVTSSNCTIGGVFTGLGISPWMLKEVIGVMKAYTTRVGEGPFPTELNDAVGERLRVAGNEYGATTGRPRRCGWLDLVVMRYSIRINGITKLVMTKLDTLQGFDKIMIAHAYRHKSTDQEISEFPCSVSQLEQVVPVYKEMDGWSDLQSAEHFSQLPKNAQAYVQYVSDFLGVQIVMIGVGQSRENICLGPVEANI